MSLFSKPLLTCPKQIEEAVRKEKDQFKRFAEYVENERELNNKSSMDRFKKLEEENKQLKEQMNILIENQANDNNRTPTDSQLKEKNDMNSGGKTKQKSKKAKKQKSKKAKKQKSKKAKKQKSKKAKKQKSKKAKRRTRKH